jgi:hypothetical protein
MKFRFRRSMLLLALAAIAPRSLVAGDLRFVTQAQPMRSG